MSEREWDELVEAGNAKCEREELAKLLFVASGGTKHRWESCDQYERDGYLEMADRLQPYIQQRVDAAVQAERGEPVAYLCPNNCGCIWRDNRDGTMSLYGENSKSCKVCEFLPLTDLIPLHIAAAIHSGEKPLDSSKSKE